MIRPTTALLAAGVGVAAVSLLSAQAGAVPAGNEPHHRRVLYTNDLRVFDVTLPPGETAADHVHANDMATVVVGEGVLRVSRDGRDVSEAGPRAPGTVVVTELTGTPATYRLTNAGATPIHLIEVENMREGGGWLTAGPMTAAGTTVRQQTRGFVVYDVRVKPGEAASMHAHAWSTLVLPVEGTMENGGIGGEDPVQLRGIGPWLPLPRAQSHTVGAVGGEAHVVEIEAR